jgi:protein CpxP
MKSFNNKVIATALALVLGTTGLVAGSAMAKEPSHNKQHHMKMMVKKLDLSEEQKQLLKSQRQAAKADRQAMRAEKLAFQQQMESLVKAADFDEQAVRDLIAEQQAKMLETQVSKARDQHNLWKILDEEQQQKLSAISKGKLKAQFKNKARKGKQDMRILRQLDLSEDQKEQIRSLVQQRVANIDPFADGPHAKMESIKALTQTDSFNESAVSAIISDDLDKHLEKKVAALKVRHQIWHILNSEQQAAFEEIKQQRMEKKHARRDKNA